jgi:magnesium chelatase family protein
MLMIGPPGSGKSMLAKRIPTIMPVPSVEERTGDPECRISAAGRTLSGDALGDARPFRSPHHTVSDVALLGGGSIPGPGEISLAHHGVLFLDELPEFKRSALEVMRQPLEDGEVTVSRSAGKVTFPCAFMLVAAMNPCPCGHLGDARHACRCTPAQVQRYRARISGPLLDRIDLHTEAPALTLAELRNSQLGETSSAMREGSRPPATGNCCVSPAERAQPMRGWDTLRFAATARSMHASAISCSRPWNNCASPREPTTAFSRSLARSLTSLAPT